MNVDAEMLAEGLRRALGVGRDRDRVQHPGKRSESFGHAGQQLAAALAHAGAVHVEHEVLEGERSIAGDIQCEHARSSRPRRHLRVCR